jgi:hypothetical protein
MKQKSEIGKKSREKEENNLINIQNSKDKEKNKTFSGLQALDTMEEFIRSAGNLDITVTAAEWLGFNYSISIINKIERTPEETMLLMDDLLRHTITEHGNKKFENNIPIIYQSPTYDYWGMTCLHPSIEKAQRLAEKVLQATSSK